FVSLKRLGVPRPEVQSVMHHSLRQPDLRPGAVEVRTARLAHMHQTSQAAYLSETHAAPDSGNEALGITLVEAMRMENDAAGQHGGEPCRNLKMLMNHHEVRLSCLGEVGHMPGDEPAMRRCERRDVSRFKRVEDLMYALGHDAGRAPMAARGNKVVNAQVDGVGNVPVRRRSPGQHDKDVHCPTPTKSQANGAGAQLTRSGQPLTFAVDANPRLAAMSAPLEQNRYKNGTTQSQRSSACAQCREFSGRSGGKHPGTVVQGLRAHLRR